MEHERWKASVLIVAGVAGLFLGAWIGFVGWTETRTEWTFGPEGYGLYEAEYGFIDPITGTGAILVSLLVIGAGVWLISQAAKTPVSVEGSSRDTVEAHEPPAFRDVHRGGRASFR